MFRLMIRSKSGNVALAALGVVYAVTSLVVLVWFVIDVWSAAAMLDRAIQVCLAATAICGLWLAFNGLRNLRVNGGWRGRHQG
jgi:hypothetical protein